MSSDEMSGFIEAEVERLLRRQFERLEQEAVTFLMMGYDKTQLIIVQYPDGHREIHPKDNADA